MQERAVDTLELIIDNKIRYTRLKGLREKDYGILEGQDEFLLPWKYSNRRSYSTMESNYHVAIG